jgi:serine/threonine protein kinase
MSTLGGIPLEVGDVLAKKYRLERLLGEGGTGVVALARHLQLEQRVAIKFLRTALASDDVRTRFEREARAISRIQSEHVVLVLDVGALDDGEPYMVMEYLDGRDLAKILKEDGPLSLEDAVDCMLQVCEALGEAHAAGIVHRDLKPANLFLTRREDGAPHIKVVDFGISKILDKGLLGERGPREMTAAFEVLGSPRYMAPEQLRNSKAVDHRADLWSVGAVLFQLITGEYAFEGESNVQASLKVMTGEPAKLRTLAPDVPPELEAIVSKCLTKDVTKRYQSARELADALRPFASERTRDSLERLEQAREAPSLNISLDVASVVPPSRREGMSSRPPAVHIPSAPPVPRTPTPLMPPPRASSTPPVPIPRRQASTVKGNYRPSMPPGSLPPQSFEGAVASVRQVPTSPSTGVKLAIAVAGLVAVLVTFGLLTGAKLAARSAGLLPAASASSPPAAQVPTVITAARPDQVVVPLDAGRNAP